MEVPLSDVILATGGYDHTIKLWDVETAQCIRTIQHNDSQVNRLKVTPDKQLLAAATYQHVRLFDLSSSNPNPVMSFDGIAKNITSIGFQEEGKWMFTGSEDGCARVWDMRQRPNQCQRIFQTNTLVNTVCLHPNQGELIVGDQSGTIHIWDVRTDHNEQLVPAGNDTSSIQCVDVDYSGSLLAAVTSAGNLFFWDLTKHRIEGTEGDDPNNFFTKAMHKHKEHVHQKYALKCRFSPNASLISTVSADKTCKIWDVRDYSLKQTIVASNQRWIWESEFSADSRAIATVSSDGLARIWSCETGRIEREFIGHQKAITAMAFVDQAIRR